MTEHAKVVRKMWGERYGNQLATSWPMAQTIKGDSG